MKRLAVLSGLLFAGAISLMAAQQPQQGQPAPLEIQKVKDNLYMITGGGGNTAAFITQNGVVVVDTKLRGNGPGILENAPARGCAFGDYDNDGDIDIAVNCVNAIPQLLRCDSTLNRKWIKIKLVGVKSNRSGIGSRVTVTAKTKAGAAKRTSRGKSR